MTPSVESKELSVVKKFSMLTFKSPSPRKYSSPQVLFHPKDLISQLRLTPIIEDFNELKLGSSDKKSKDDFDLIGKVTEQAP